MMKLDIDYVTQKVSRFLISFPKPYDVRTSPGGTGLHIRKDCRQGCTQFNDCYACWVYQSMDDKKRLWLDISQKKHGLIHNILNDKKNGKSAGPWIRIETSQQADRFLRKFTGFW